ncbi:hypothetical protein HDV64DRAFT_198794 [Trichoderma sp. TUCIM 5745]
MELQCTILATCWNIANVCVSNYTLCWRYIYTYLFCIFNPPLPFIADVFFYFIFLFILFDWRGVVASMRWTNKHMKRRLGSRITS